MRTVVKKDKNQSFSLLKSSAEKKTKMATPSGTENGFHARSISLPSRAHPTTLEVDEALRNLKTFAELSASATSSMRVGTICNALKHLAGLYNGIEDLLSLPSVQNGLLRSGQSKWLEKDVDRALRLLEFCSRMKDAAAASKEHVQDLQFALRRKEDSSTTAKVKACIRARKEIQKMIKKSCKDLTHMDGKSESASVIPEDSDVLVVLKVLKEARIITRSLLCSIMSSMYMTKSKASWWSFSSKTTKAPAGEEDLCAMFEILKDADPERLMMAQNQLKTIASSFGEIETGLECLFRILIRNRVSLLNTLSL